MEDKVLLATVSVLVLLVVLSKLKSLLVTSQKKLNLPPGPWTLPVIGSLHHLVTSPNLYRATRSLAQKHGPLMMLRIGEVPTVVASSPETANEIMKTQDIMFADRYNNSIVGTLSFYGKDLAFAPYGEQWRQLRKICVLELLSATQVQSFRHIREDEIARFMQKLAASAATGTAVNLTKMISRLINDTFLRECIGSRCKYQDEFLDTLDTAFRLTSGLAIADLFPSWRLM
ncbi:unnamed protein product [Urochloa humidicola]